MRIVMMMTMKRERTESTEEDGERKEYYAIFINLNKTESRWNRIEKHNRKEGKKIILHVCAFNRKIFL